MSQASYPSVKRGIFFMILGMLIFSLLNAIVKDTITAYPSPQLVFFRCFLAALLPSIFLFHKKWKFPTLSEGKIHLKRAFLLAIGLSVLFLGIGMLPLANSMALYFSTTLFLVLLSYPLLREKIDAFQGIAVIVGFIGVLVIAKPTGEIFHWGALFIIIGALMEAAYNLYGRLLSSAYDTFMLTFLGSLLPACVILIVLPFFWLMPDFKGWMALIGLGIGGGLGQLCVTYAYTNAPAGILAPMIYSALLWSILLDILLYENWPTQSLFLGSGIIIASGLIIVFSEARRKKEKEV